MSVQVVAKAGMFAQPYVKRIALCAAPINVLALPESMHDLQIQVGVAVALLRLEGESCATGGCQLQPCAFREGAAHDEKLPSSPCKWKACSPFAPRAPQAHLEQTPIGNNASERIDLLSLGKGSSPS